jgi:hypothetical protein
MCIIIFSWQKNETKKSYKPIPRGLGLSDWTKTTANWIGTWVGTFGTREKRGLFFHVVLVLV